MAGSALGRHRMNHRGSSMVSSTIDTTDDGCITTVLLKAFDAAKKEDADNLLQSIKSGDDTIRDVPHYMICKPWMVLLLSFLKKKDELSRPGKICNSPLLICSNKAVATDDITEGMSSSEQSSESNGDYVVVSSPEKSLNSKSNDIIEANEKGETSWVEITRQAANEKSTEALTIRPKMSINVDYVLVGNGLWTLLSSKFGYDFSIAHLPRFSEDGGPVIVVYPPPIIWNSYQVVPIPENGMFDYSDPLPDSDLVSEDDEPPADVFPMDAIDECDASISPPILLLPPSTTAQDTSSEDNTKSESYMMVDKEEISTNAKKRKRFGAGLGNLGNTCFMNSTLQCLAHTGPIRQYFLSGEYLNDLNRDNPLGTGGELASEFATLLSQMWGTGKPTDSGNMNGNRNSYSSYSSSNYSPSGSVVYPRSFKTTLGKHAEQFMGYNQHDSQELATYLLDALHEDTNRVLKKPYVENPEQGETELDEEAAEKAWGLHLKREDSRVLESFMGQVKSRVECPRKSCGRVSTTFDPFMYLSVPVPGASERALDITYVPLGSHKRRIKLKVSVDKTGSIADLRIKVADELNTQSPGNYVINADDIVITDFWHKEVFSYYNIDDEIDKIRDNDMTFAFEVTPVASIHAHGTRMENDEKAKQPFRKRSCGEDILDLSTFTKLNTDQGWRVTLEKYVVQSLSLTTLLNRRRGAYDDRIEFYKKANEFLQQCYMSVEFQSHSSSKQIESTELHKLATRTNRDSESNLESSDEIKNDAIDRPAPVSRSSSESLDGSNQLSLAILCENSQMFQDIKAVADVAEFEVCCDKFYEFSRLELKQKCEKHCDGLEIQVIAKKQTRMYTTAQEKIIGAALMIRISPHVTVFELRKILSDRLSSVLRTNQTTIVDTESISMDNGKELQEAELVQNFSYSSEDDKKSEKIEVEFVESPVEGGVNIMRQLPLSYERKSLYSAYSSKSCAYRQLGSIPKGEGDKPSRIAMPDDDEEKETVLDIVGHRGKVNIHVPQSMEEFFNEEEWENTDDINSDKEEDPNTAAKHPTVLDCISKYCQTEQLEESEMWYCNRCKDHVQAWKQIHLYRAPPILIIHLKRFQYSAITHRRDKIDTFVDFPLRGLDLRGEVLHWSNGEEPIYDCYAVSNHYGGLGGGHYTAYARNDDGEWCYFDDSRVTTLVEEKEVVSVAAYVLYYRRRDIKVDDDEVDRNRTRPRVCVDSDNQHLTKSMDVEESGAASRLSVSGMSTGGTSDEDMEYSSQTTLSERADQE